MRPLIQIKMKIKFLMKYLLFYFLGTFLLVYLFSVLYAMKGVPSQFELSFEIFWGIESEFPESIQIIAYCEKVTYDLFSVIFVGAVLVRLLQPLNPIKFCNYVVYDTVDKKFSFRYWIMLPKGKYLYDVKLRILVTDHESHHRGINQLHSFWEANGDLPQARGIRFVELDQNESQNLKKEIEKMKQKIAGHGGEVKERYAVDFSIRGISESGTTYCGWRRYKDDEIITGYRHVPLQRHTYDSEYFYRTKPIDEEKVDISKDFYEKGKKEFFRYQHFDKVYRLSESKPALLAQKRGDVLTEKQIRHGQYAFPKQQFLDLISFWVWFFLDSDKKIRWIFHKAFQYILHICHIKRY